MGEGVKESVGATGEDGIGRMGEARRGWRSEPSVGVGLPVWVCMYWMRMNDRAG